MVVSNALTNPLIVAQYVRVLPVTWYNYISMRVDFYGCIPGKVIQKIYHDNLQLSDNAKHDSLRSLLSVEALHVDGAPSSCFQFVAMIFFRLIDSPWLSLQETNIF